MSLLKWKQLDNELAPKTFTGSLFIEGDIFLNGESVKNKLKGLTVENGVTTLDSLKLTGPLVLDLDINSGSPFTLKKGGDEVFKIEEAGNLVFQPIDPPAVVQPGSFYFGKDQNFYFGTS